MNENTASEKNHACSSSSMHNLILSGTWLSHNISNGEAYVQIININEASYSAYFYHTKKIPYPIHNVFNTWHWRQQWLTLTLTSLFPTAIPISARSFSKEAIISVARFFWWLVISLSFWSSASILAKVTYSKTSYPWLNKTHSFSWN